MKFILIILMGFFCTISHSQTRDFSAYDTLGNYYLKSIDSLQKKIKTQPKNAALYYQKSALIFEFIDKDGSILRQGAKYTIADAIKDVTKAIQIKSDTADFYVLRSQCYEYYENDDSTKIAINDITKAIAIAPNTPSLYKSRAILNASINIDKNIICADLKKAMDLGDGEAKETYLKNCK